MPLQLFLLLTLLSLPGSAQTGAPSPKPEPPAVTTREGSLRGTIAGGLRAYQGVPYAAPPIGPLRWKPPAAPAPWSGTRDANHFGDSCTQRRAPSSEAGMSEDCLYLNIWTPAPDEHARLPVMVWIHGGGFVGGSGVSNGANLARKGVVLVTLNYRLGVFGFLAHPELTAESPHRASGNYGLLDQIAALHWIKDNIAAFGGDPARVTVFGESAGGTSVGYLLVSPLARGLFAQAILESPSRLFLPDPKLSVSYAGLPSMESVGVAIDPSLAHLRQLSTQDVMDRAAQVTATLFAPGGPDRIGLRPESHVHVPEARDHPWWAFVDGYVIPAPVSDAFAKGEELTVPLLLGTNANEGSVFVGHFPPATEAEYRTYLRTSYPPCGDALLSLYPASTQPEIRHAVDGLITDAFFLYGVESIAPAATRKNSPAFVYRFSRVSPRSRLSGAGAFHGAEVPYVFGLTPAPGVYDSTDARVSSEVMNAWVEFAARGNPSLASLSWPAWKPSARAYLDFGDQTIVRELKDLHPFQLFAEIFAPHPPQACATAP